MFKFFDSSYFLIYDQNRFYFYTQSVRSFEKILEDSVENIDILIQHIKALRIRQMTVFDHQSDSIIKFEKCLSSLSILDFYSWYKKKKEIVLKNADWSRGSFLWREKALFMLGITTSFLEKLQSSCDLDLSVYSYSVELGYSFRRFLEKKNNFYPKTCLISIDAQYQMNIWFFDDKKILFFRSWEGGQSIHLERQIRSAIVDTLRYLEKMTDQTGKMIFMMHQRKEAVAHMLMMAFPEALFFYDDDVLTNPSTKDVPKDSNAFDFFLLQQKERFFPLKKVKKNLKSYFRLNNVISLMTLTMIVYSVFLIYQNTSIFFQTREIKKQLMEKQDQFENLSRQPPNIPLSIDQIEFLKNLEEICLQQQNRFWSFVEELSVVLEDQYILEKLKLNQEKTQLFVKAYKESGSMEEFLHRWDHALSDYPIQTSAVEHQSESQAEGSENALSLLNDPLVITCASVFRHFQKEDKAQ